MLAKLRMEFADVENEYRTMQRNTDIQKNKVNWLSLSYGGIIKNSFDIMQGKGNNGTEITRGLTHVRQGEKTK